MSSSTPAWLLDDIKDVDNASSIRDKYKNDLDNDQYENVELGHTTRVVTTSTIGEPKHKNIVSMIFKIVNMGLCVMEAACGGLGIVHATSIKDTALVFIGLYMILFAAIIFLFELIQIRPCGYIDEVWKKNFGFLYGVGGKSLFIIFMAILAFGIDEPKVKAMAISTGVIVLFGGVVQGIIYWKWPEYFDKKEKFVPH